MSYRERVIQYPVKVEPRLTEFGEVITLDKWFVQHFNQAIRNKVVQQNYPYFFYIEFESNKVPDVSYWFVQHFNQAVRVKAKPHLYQSFAIDADLLTQPENITSDKWKPNYPDKIYDLKRQQYTYPFWVGYEEEPYEAITDLPEWFVNTNVPVFARFIVANRRPQLYPYFLPDPSTFFVRALGFIRGLNKDTNTGIGTRGKPIIGRNNDTNTIVGKRLN